MPTPDPFWLPPQPSTSAAPPSLSPVSDLWPRATLPVHIRSRAVNKVAVNPEHSSVLSAFGSISVPPVAIRSGLTWTYQRHTSKHAFFSCDVPCPSTRSCFSGEAATAFLSLSERFFMFWPIKVCPYDVFLAELKKAFAHPVSEFSMRATVVLPNLYFCKQKMTWWRTTSLKYLASKKI